MGPEMEMARRPATVGFMVVSLALWALSAAVRLAAFKAPLAALVAPIAPGHFGCLILASSSPAAGIFSVGVAGIAAAPVLLSLIREPRRPVVALAHVTLAGYWLWGPALLAAGL